MPSLINNKYHPARACLNKEFTLLANTLLMATTLCISTANAQGVLAGSDIENKAVVTYSVTGEAQVPVESSPTGNILPGLGNGVATVFKVDRKIDLSITSQGDTEVTLGETQAELMFTLSNDGNDIQEFLLTPNSTLTSDNFDTSLCKIEITAVTDPPLPDVVLPAIDTIKLKADQQASISVKCNIPFDNNGQAILKDDKSLLSINALASKNDDGSAVNEENTPDSAENIETVFTDSAGSDDANRDASHSTRAFYIALDPATANPPTLNINKSILSVIDPQGGSKAITGSKVTYKITISTAGEGVIKNVIITDPTPVGMTYKTSSIILNNTNLTDAIDTDQGEFNTSNNISTINLGDITAGSQQVIKLTYTINQTNSQTDH